MSEKKKLVVLVANGVSDRKQATDQSRAIQVLQARGTLHDIVDGLNPEHKERRNELFEISGIRGNYPQFFFLDQNGETTFIGGWEKMEMLNDTSSLPEEVLKANPDMETWDKVFENVVDSFT